MDLLMILVITALVITTFAILFNGVRRLPFQGKMERDQFKNSVEKESSSPKINKTNNPYTF